MYTNNLETNETNNSDIAREDPNFFLQNQQCYRFETIHNQNGIFDKCIDATYIISMENSPRLSHILEQISTFRPTSLVYILHNKGYKECTKRLHRQLSIEDLVDANFQIFFHAYNNQFDNILILEDDCVFSEKLFDPNVVTDVCQFLNEHKNTEFIYGLGILPWFILPSTTNHHQCLLFTASHAWVHSKQMREKILFDVTQEEFKTHWDNETLFKNWNNFNIYTYKYPLAYQKFEETDNYSVWTADFPKVLQPIFTFLISLFQNVAFTENTDPEKIFDNFYFYSKIWSYTILCLLVLIVFCLIICLISFVTRILNKNKTK